MELRINRVRINRAQPVRIYIPGELEISEDRLQIKYQGKVLKKIHSLGYLGVCRETILKAEVQFYGTFFLIIKFFGCQQ